ncbi:unnamed protein product [Owenia fusiformis]|uniref:HAUS augmin-like complex subunit 7 n=1 Tax=Owenia fusiformis TaxID=6347 RepID=A0A8S4NQK2_OWEFU|nr:unnamed protein product [Owenia fusiformis]
MAAISNEKYLAHSFKVKLDALGCPFTDGVEETWILELVFKAGEARIRLLQWLFSKFDTKLADLLDPQYASRDSKMDSRIQRLLYVASMIGLCRYDDVDIIRGVSSKKKQISFMEQLIDLVAVQDAADNPSKQAMMSPGLISDAMSVDSQFEKDCWYVDSLATQDLDNVFSSRVALLPHDLSTLVHRQWQAKGISSHDIKPLPDVQALLDESTRLVDDIARQTEVLNEITKLHAYPQDDPRTVSKVCQTLRIVLSELSQLVTSFSYCYENEMKQWCNKTPPNLSQLGPAFKRVHSMLQKFTALLQGLGDIRESYSTIISRNTATETTFSNLGQSKTSVGELVSVSQAAATSFQECLSVLGESRQRLDDTQSTLAASTFSILQQS